MPLRCSAVRDPVDHNRVRENDTLLNPIMKTFWIVNNVSTGTSGGRGRMGDLVVQALAEQR